ncbi:MAG: glycosyltransferase [Planctomycetes bacterium]|nr:glycosyltransferase [Planctomycetota bacterium]MCC7399550.1 glycosyltransferase [Planctomycetota bacterium]
MADVKAALRVCMVVHAYYEGDARVRRYAESLAAGGHQVTVLALRDRGKAKVEALRGVRVERLPLSRRRGGTLRYLFEYCWFTLLCGLVLTWRWRRYDVVHVHNMPDFLVFAALVPRLFGRVVLLDVHDLMPEVYCSKFKTSVRHPGIWPIRVQEWLSHRFASACIFATERFRRGALERGTVREHRSIAVMNAADTTLFDRQAAPWRGPDDGTFVMLYLGTVSHRHGVDQCVRVLPLVRERLPGIRLRIHAKLSEAEGKPLQELEALASELGVRDLVEIGPPLPLQEVPAAMSRASVGVFTPHLDVHIDMALSLKVPEFVAMDVPVIAVRTSIMTSLFREDEVLMFADGDLPAFADLLVRLHGDPAAGRAMVMRARRFTQEHAWENEFAGYRELLARLTGRSLAKAAG